VFPLAHHPDGPRQSTTHISALQRPKTFPEFQTMFDHIYGEKNRKDYPSGSDLVLRLMEEGSIIMELARKDTRKDFRRQLARGFSWYVALANRAKVDLNEALWFKYPGVCPYCMKTESCVCGLEQPKVEGKEEMLRRLRKERASMPKTLEDNRVFHAILYGPQNKRIMPIQTAAHLVEEMGEVSRELRHRKRQDFCNEMADVGSWFFALATRLEFVPFDDLVWEAFPYECDMCHQEMCACEGVI